MEQGRRTNQTQCVQPTTVKTPLIQAGRLECRLVLTDLRELLFTLLGVTGVHGGYA